MKGFALVCSVHEQVQAVLAVAAVCPAVGSTGPSGMDIVAMDAMNEVVVRVVVLMQQGPC